MRYRIGAWATSGFLVASFWALLLFPTAPTPTLLIARVTCPVAFVGIGLRFYWALLANAATYALIGAVLEMCRRDKASA